MNVAAGDFTTAVCGADGRARARGQGASVPLLKLWDRWKGGKKLFLGLD